MKNRLNINNNFATVRRGRRDLKRVRRGAGTTGGSAGRDLAALAKPLTSAAASLQAAAPVTALAPTVSAALAAPACLNIIARRSTERFNIALTSFNIYMKFSAQPRAGAAGSAIGKNVKLLNRYPLNSKFAVN